MNNTKIESESGSKAGYYDTAWTGFKGDKVDVRIRVEGADISKEKPIEMYITSIGGAAVDPAKCSIVLPETSRFGTVEEPISHWNGSAQANYVINEIGGYNVKFEDTNTAFYYEDVPVSSFTSTTKAINFYVNMLGNRNVQMYVDLIDSADSSNYVSVKINSKDGSSLYDSSMLAAVPSIGQQYTGKFIGQNAVRINSTAGTRKYSNITVSNGGDYERNISYAPIHFSYDNTNKQVALTTIDNDYNNASLRHIVADLDDTTTSLTYYLHDGTVYNNKVENGTRTGFFDTAWTGFTGNTVDVRIRVEGTDISEAKPIEMYITSIGGQAIDKTKASVAPYYTLSMVNGASIRTTADSQGIRFAAKLTAAEYAQYAAMENVEFGMLIIPTELLNGDLTVETADASKTVVSKDKIYLSEDIGAYCYNVAMTGVPDGYRTLALSARAYVKVGEVYYYADYCEEFHSRSLAKTAKLALENGWTSTDASATAYMKELAALAGWVEGA